MLAIFKRLVKEGHTLYSNPLRGVSTFILRREHGDYEISEQTYNKAYRLSKTKILRALYADT